MKLTRRANTLYIRKRVPRRYKRIEEREFVWLSLHTDAEAVAKHKAPQVWSQMIEAWEARLAGATGEADERLDAAKNLAAMQGFRFMFAPEVAKLPQDEFIGRLRSAVTPKGNIDLPMAEALLGGVEEPKITLSRALSMYWDYMGEKTLGKSDDQVRRWRAPRMKAIANLIKAIGDKEIGQINRDDLELFKAGWLARIKAEGLSINSANKDLIHVTSTLKAVALRKSIVLGFNTDKLSLSEGKKNTRPPFSEAWIREKLLGEGALARLNAEARAILLGMVNTGYRPSEGAMLTAAQIKLDAAVPHIKIEGVGRQLKTPHSERIIPLVGVSLEAFRQFPNGFPRYADNPGLSATVNKFLRTNGLMEGDGHSMYSLRHSFEDRLLAAGVDERIRRDLMGHSLNRERYGSGASLTQMQEIIKKIAI